MSKEQSEKNPTILIFFKYAKLTNTGVKLEHLAMSTAKLRRHNFREGSYHMLTINKSKLYNI